MIGSCETRLSSTNRMSSTALISTTSASNGERSPLTTAGAGLKGCRMRATRSSQEAALSGIPIDSRIIPSTGKPASGKMAL